MRKSTSHPAAAITVAVFFSLCGILQANKYGSVEPIANEALELLRPGLPASIKVSPPAMGSVGLIKGDATEVHQVIMNLCTNAVRAMPRGGEDTVWVARRPA